MKKKQKITLYRIIITAVMLVVLQFLPITGIPRLIAYLAAYLVIGYDILRKAGKGILNGRAFDENFLMALATLGAFFLAIWTKSGDYLEGIAVMLFYQIGELFQSYAVGKSRKNISALMDIRPDYANIEKDGKLEQVDPDEVAVGSIIVVQPGEKVPLDGVVESGNASLNTSALTGESLPRDVKEGDEIIHQVETRNNVEALFFTDKQQVYKVRLSELEDGKVAQMGIYLPGRLGMEEGENILAMVITGDYSGYVLFFFAGGKCAKIPLASYATKQNRRKLLKAYSDKEPLAKLLFLPEDTELAIRTSAGRMLLVNTAQIAAKTTRDSQGVAVVTLKKNQTIASVVPAETLELANPHRYRVRSLPATGALIRAEDEGEQMSLL